MLVGGMFIVKIRRLRGRKVFDNRFVVILLGIQEEGSSETGASPLRAVRISEEPFDAESEQKRPKMVEYLPTSEARRAGSP